MRNAINTTCLVAILSVLMLFAPYVTAGGTTDEKVDAGEIYEGVALSMTRYFPPNTVNSQILSSHTTETTAKAVKAGSLIIVRHYAFTDASVEYKAVMRLYEYNEETEEYDIQIDSATDWSSYTTTTTATWRDQYVQIPPMADADTFYTAHIQVDSEGGGISDQASIDVYIRAIPFDPGDLWSSTYDDREQSRAYTENICHEYDEIENTCTVVAHGTYNTYLQTYVIAYAYNRNNEQYWGEYKLWDDDDPSKTDTREFLVTQYDSIQTLPLRLLYTSDDVGETHTIKTSIKIYEDSTKTNLLYRDSDEMDVEFKAPD